MILGLVIFLVGLLLTFTGRLPFRIGRLPGDVLYRGKNTTVYFPIVTCIVVSAILTLVMWLLNRR